MSHAPRAGQVSRFALWGSTGSPALQLGEAVPPPTPRPPQAASCSPAAGAAAR